MQGSINAAPGVHSDRQSRCCAPEDQHDARRVATHLDIPHFTFDRRELCKEHWIEPFGDVHQHHAQELGITGKKSMMIGRPGDEIIGKIGPAFRHRGNIVNREVQFLEGKAASLPDHAGQQGVPGDGKRMAFRPGRGAVASPLDAKKAIRIQPQPSRAHMIDRMQGIADDHLLCRK